MKKKIILVMVCLLALCGCGKIPKLQDGKEAVVTFKKDDKEFMLSAEDLYKELKDSYGLDATVNLIDKYILEQEFADYIETAQQNAEYYLDALRESYDTEEDLLNDIKKYTSFQTIEAYQASLYLSFMQSHAVTEYAKSLVTDEEIQKYYDQDAKEDVEIYQILITPDVTDSMTSDEKAAKEEEAKNLAKDIIKQLDEAENKLETFKSLVKEHSDDEASKEKDGNLGYVNYNDLDEEYDELLDAVYKLQNGEYSKEVITTELGYHVIYRNASKEKDALEDIKDDIIETLGNQKIANDSTMSTTGLKYYRDLYNMDIIDSEIDRQYGIYMTNLLTGSTTN